MSDSFARTYTTIDGDMIDAIAQHQYGFVDDALEAIIAENPFLRDQPERLPAGLVITFPKLQPKVADRFRRIWDV